MMRPGNGGKSDKDNLEFERPVNRHIITAMPIQRPTVYALISIACPFIFALGIKIYQQSGQVWNMSGNTESDHVAEALLAFADVVQFVLVILIGCVFGLIFGAVSLIKKKRIVSIGLVGVILNLLPFLALLILLLSKGI